MVVEVVEVVVVKACVRELPTEIARQPEMARTVAGMANPAHPRSTHALSLHDCGFRKYNTMFVSCNML